MRPAWSKSETPSIAGLRYPCVKIHRRTLSVLKCIAPRRQGFESRSRRRLTSSPVCCFQGGVPRRVLGQARTRRNTDNQKRFREIVK